MNRPGGIPIIIWIAGLAAGIGGFVWLKKRNAGASSASPSTAGKTGQPAFSQAQEVQDFQVFSSLTSAQQASDLNFLSEVASLVGGGSSTGTNSGSSSPTSTGTAPPSTINSSTVAGQKTSETGDLTDPNRTPITSGGYTYEPFDSGAAAGQYAKLGGSEYVEDAPGIFSALKKGQNPGNNYVYARES
jgi:hypothetical protein